MNTTTASGAPRNAGGVRRSVAGWSAPLFEWTTNREWRRQEFYRSVPVPAGIDADKVEATYRNGILSVKLPKTEQGKGRRIAVKT